MAKIRAARSKAPVVRYAAQGPVAETDNQSTTNRSPAILTSNNKSRSGAEVLIDALKINAVERIFCIPGESYLAALDALFDRSEISLVVCRNEGGAAYMAEADGKLWRCRIRRR
jgi:hypothetical protein